MTVWGVKADAQGGKPDEARVPDAWFSQEGADRAPYVRLSTTDGKPVILKVVASGNATSSKLLVTPGTLGLRNNDTKDDVDATPLSRGDYRRDWLTHTAAGKWTIAGVLVILAGQVIQVSLDIGKHWVVFDVGPAGIAFLNVAKDVLTFGGAIIAAWQVVLKS